MDGKALVCTSRTRLGTHFTRGVEWEGSVKFEQLLYPVFEIRAPVKGSSDWALEVSFLVLGPRIRPTSVSSLEYVRP